MTRPVHARARLRASLAGLAALTLLIAVVFLAVFVARRTIAEHMALDWLRRRGVAATVNVRTLGLTRMEAQIRLGPKDAPGLSADSIEMDYRITGPWEGRALGLEPGRLVFNAPRLSARYDGRRFDFGVLRPVIDDLLAHPRVARGPQPSIAIRRGRLELATPHGRVTLSGDATVSEGRLDRLEGAVGPIDLSDPRFRIVAAGGARLGVTREGGVLTVSLKGPFSDLRIGGANARQGVVSLWARAPYPDPTGLHGPAQVIADVTAQLGSAGGLRVGDASAHATLTGALAVDDQGQSFAGTLGLRWAADDMATPEVRARRVAANVQLTTIRFDHRDSGTTWQARVSADTRAGRLTGPDLTVTNLTLAARGQASDAGARLDGRLSARAGATRKAIETLGLDRWAPGYAEASARALRDFAVSAPAWRMTLDRRGWQVALPAPMVFAAGAGARLTVSGRPGTALARGGSNGTKGAFDAVLAGGGLPDLRLQVSGWSASAGRIGADLAARARLDLDLAKDVRADMRGHADLSSGRASFTMDGCAPVSAATMGSGDVRLTKIAMRLCPDGGPLATADRGGWRMRGRIEDSGAENAATAVRIADAGATFQADGGTRQTITGTLRLTGARLSDQASEPRFTPVAVTGQATIDGDAMRGVFALSTPKGQTLTDMKFTNDLRQGSGRAHLTTRALAFAANGLQPSDIAPMLRTMRHAHGHVDFTGDLAWSVRGMTSSGVVSTRDLGFTSPVGDVVDVAGDVSLTSLAPLTTAPNQTIKAKRVDGVVSITDVKVGFDASATALDIASADAVVASGHASVDSLHIDLDPKAIWGGTLILRHVDVGRLIAASSLANSMKLEAVVDGRLPFEAGPAGVRFMHGRIEASSPGRLTIARTALSGAGPAANGGATVNNAAQDFAYQALEDLAFDSLDASIDSVADDRLRVLFHIKGRHDPPAKTRATVSLWSLMHGKAFDKPLPLPSDTKINLTLDTSLNFGELTRSLDAIWNSGARERSPPVQGPGPQ